MIEYKEVWHTNPVVLRPGAPTLIDILNEQGKDGWILCHITNVGSSQKVILLYRDVT